MSDDRARRPAGAPRTTAVQRVLDAHAEQLRATRGRALRVLDLGGGTGGTAVPLAVAGHELTVVDPSPDALFSLRRRAVEQGVEQRVRALQGDADTVGALVGPEAAFDLVCLHGTLEVVDDPGAAVGAAAALLAPDATLSLVVAQRLHAVLSNALAGRLERARAVLERPDGRWGEEDPVPRRFDEPAVVALVQEHGLTPVHVQGVRVFADLVPSALLDSEADRAALLALEEAAAQAEEHRLLGSLGSALHVLARRG
ncbi:methyltransferase domain-containing protein [Phycicoccus endophyticus]|uniref:Methyltransferase domain-containing protein n=1 Tax=Phycicoccus endophyticus TaxID=1690220 RepID=A0A7G9R4W9_9MICO|nr:class I SAM-dependent methyltransferase [Phycicoccus endophyticus]NHI18574.1 methyltransferase domain-containing protein [Phycicoccus endophyticus]QNN50644.1 methyltransferase domain-containing protein [Phycicoccus endophyticus]GGL22717.1 methyltransferase [Phycicoccus endophyticus]